MLLLSLQFSFVSIHSISSFFLPFRFTTLTSSCFVYSNPMILRMKNLIPQATWLYKALHKKATLSCCCQNTTEVVFFSQNSQTQIQKYLFTPFFIYGVIAYDSTQATIRKWGMKIVVLLYVALYFFFENTTFCMNFIHT